MTQRTLDKRRTCAECGKRGATRAGVCLGCVVEILAFETPKTRVGKTYLAEFKKRAAAGDGRR